MASPSSGAFNATTNAPIASIGVPTEIKRDEQRVALTPGGVRELVSHGLELRIQSQAGAGAGSSDAGFAAAGAQLVSAELVQQMRPGSGIVDVAIDQGGCIATSRETTHTEPVVTIHGGQYYAVGHMPGAVPFTSTEALVSVTLPSILAIAGRGLAEAITNRPELASGLNTIDGAVCHPGVAKVLGVPSRHPMACLR